MNLGNLMINIGLDTSKLRAELDKAKTNINQFQQNFSQGMGNVAQSTRDAQRDLGNLSNSIGVLKNAVIGSFIVRGLKDITAAAIESRIAMEAIEVQYKAIFGSADAGAREFANVSKFTRQYGLDLKSTADSYGKFQAAAKYSTMTSEDVRKSFEGISVAIGGLHLNADKAQRIFLQLQQMMSKGKVQAEELRVVAESLPGTYGMVATSMGITGTELAAKMRKGTLDANDLVRNLGKFGFSEFGAAADEAASKGQAALNRFNSTLFDTQQQMGRQLMPSFIFWLQTLEDILKTMGGITLKMQQMSTGSADGISKARLWAAGKMPGDSITGPDGPSGNFITRMFSKKQQEEYKKSKAMLESWKQEQYKENEERFKPKIVERTPAEIAAEQAKKDKMMEAEIAARNGIENQKIVDAISRERMAITKAIHKWKDTASFTEETAGASEYSKMLARIELQAKAMKEPQYITNRKTVVKGEYVKDMKGKDGSSYTVSAKKGEEGARLTIKSEQVTEEIDKVTAEMRRKVDEAKDEILKVGASAYFKAHHKQADDALEDIRKRTKDLTSLELTEYELKLQSINKTISDMPAFKDRLQMKKEGLLPSEEIAKLDKEMKDVSDALTSEFKTKEITAAMKSIKSETDKLSIGFKNAVDNFDENSLVAKMNTADAATSKWAEAWLPQLRMIRDAEGELSLEADKLIGKIEALGKVAGLTVLQKQFNDAGAKQKETNEQLLAANDQAMQPRRISATDGGALVRTIDGRKQENSQIYNEVWGNAATNKKFTDLEAGMNKPGIPQEEFDRMSKEWDKLVADTDQEVKIKIDASEIKDAQDTIGGFTSALEGPLADSFLKFAQTGKVNFGELAGSMYKMLQVYAAQKTAHLLMEAAYNGIMGLVYTAQYNSEAAARSYAAASASIAGAAIMGGFVIGSGLASMAGQAHSGIDSIPEDGTWLLQKGERVVDAKTNQDLKESLRNGGGGGNNVTLNVTIQGGDEQSTLKAIPKMREMVLDAINSDISSGGRTLKTIKAYAGN